MIKRLPDDSLWHRYLKIMILTILMCVLAVFVSLLIMINNKKAMSSKNCSFANACKVLAYIEGYDESKKNKEPSDDVRYWFDDYFDYLCDIEMFNEDMTDDKGADRVLLQSDISCVYSYIGIPVESDLRYDKAISNTEFIEIINKYRTYFKCGERLNKIQLGIVAACGEADSTEGVFNELYTVCTNKGKYYYTGLNFNGYKDKTVEVLTIDNEILMVTDIITQKTIFKNVWISEFKDNTLYVNMYGVNREFYIGGTTENVNEMLADIELEDGRLISITVKKDITDMDIRILLFNVSKNSEFYEFAEITSDSTFYVTCDNVVSEYASGTHVNITADDGAGRYNIKAEGAGKIQILSISKSQGNPEYEGELDVFADERGVAIVNELPIEDYLKKVVPSEMPASFGVEALKVQAVCARSYAYAHIDSYAYSEFAAHMDDTINYQVYNNTEEKEAANEAIIATCGKMLYYADEIITAYYYSTSCGSGADVSLWGSDVSFYPYYKSKLISLNGTDMDLSDEKSFRKFITSENINDYDYGCNYYRWKVEKNGQQIIANMKKLGYTDIGEVSEINIDNRVAGGAVNKVTVKGTKADVCLDSESVIRKVFDLPSSFFVTDSTGKNGSVNFLFTGGGYGHGIGMSQNAVKRMTEQGMDYISVLRFFYDGSSVF